MLIQDSQGMFLWIAFQIDDICSQHNDEDILQALGNLPKDLTETFNRALFRILAKGNAKTVKQVFRWVAAAKRPLSLEELREGIAIEPGQPYFKLERLLNGISRVTAWCENRIVLDEEDKIVQFAHHTVQQYLLGLPSEKRLSEFHFQLRDADHEVGESCVTYLNDFKAQLIRQPKPQVPITPSAILEIALKHRTEPTVPTSLVQLVLSRHHRKTVKVDVAQKLANYRGSSNEDSSEKLQLGHPFLGYASENWLLHTTNFEHGRSKTWSLWTQMLQNEQSLGQTPWTHKQFIERDRVVAEWICNENHRALLRIIENSDRPFPEEERIYLISDISWKGNLALLEIFLEAGHSLPSETAVALQIAAEEGHLEIVDRLLAANADVNAGTTNNSGWTALHLAVSKGHLEIVDRLLAVNADVNAVTKKSRDTALKLADKRRYFDIKTRLERAGAYL